MSYETTRAHLLAELDRIGDLLETYGMTTDPIPSSSDPAPVGEVELARDPTTLSLGLPTDATQRFADRAAQIDERCQDTSAEVPLRLRILTDRFDLSRAHLDVFLLSLAPEVDADYQDFFRELHGDTVTHPTVGLITELFSRTEEEGLAATALIGPSSLLRQHDLVRLSDPVEPSRSRQHRLVTVDQRLVSYLEGHVDLDPALEHVAALSTPDRTLEDLPLESALRDRLERVDADSSGRYYFYGPDDDEREAAINALADDRLLRASLPAVLEADAVERLHREALLQDCPVHLTDADVLSERESDRTLEEIFDRFSDLHCDLFVTGTEAWRPTGTTVGVDAILEFPRPSIETRRAFWEDRADELPADLEPAVLAGTFELTRGQLEAALATARSLASGDDLTADDIYEGCRAQSAGGLGELAQRIEPASDWDDIQLREKTNRELRLIRDHIANRARVYREWGFAEEFARGTGVVALFKGKSGTGKTMAAEVLADDVGMALYKIDLSSVVSKYIGETEENLERIFRAANHSNAILLFDEADSIFGDRAEVSDATDRYANVEVNYLLQRIESYDGVVVLTTNHASNIDSAFERRIDHTVTFTRPKGPVREAIWAGVFPDDAPLGDLDYEFLSSLDLTGGQIRKIGQTAAILAAGDDRRIEMRHVVRALEQEFGARGQLLRSIDFGEHRRHLRSVDDDGQTGTDGRSADADEEAVGRSPEAVIRRFFELLDAGKGDHARELYHSRTLAEEFSRKELAMIAHGDLSVAGEIDRVRDDHDRVILEFDRELNGDRTPRSYELRPEDDVWRIFNVERVRENDVVVN
ncbi:ATP-binding protein [Natrinema sp. SYSU A 869]|uniref:ATP-binding protein n=1 Tax=Natrinema sp. SYSU A 869 TaxID=2871694 RepID=UPI001CA44DCF|nr:ATP-binding protein [Natrinema sp. SYSU A 869]